MAKITQMATTASTEVVSLQQDERHSEREVKKEEQKQEKDKVRLWEGLTQLHVIASRIPWKLVSLSFASQTGSRLSGYLWVSCSMLLLNTNINVNIQHFPC